MKKLLAMLLALMMALSCVSAFAEEAAVPTAETPVMMPQRYVMGISLGKTFVQGVLPMMGLQLDADTVEQLLGILDKMTVEVVVSPDCIQETVLADGQKLYDETIMMDENGVVIVSDLAPHYAFTLSFEELGQMLRQMAASLNDGEEPKALTEEEMQAMMAEMQEKLQTVAAALQPYMDDISASLGAIQQNAQMTEDGAMVITVTRQQVTALAGALVERFANDETLKPMVQSVLDQVAKMQGGEPVSLDEKIAELQANMAQSMAEEDQVLATAVMRQNEDGSVSVDVNSQDMVYVSVASAPENMMITALIGQQPIEDPETAWNDLLAGKNYTDEGIQMTVVGPENAQTITADLYLSGVNAQIVGHQYVDVDAQGTPDYSALSDWTLNVPMLGGEVLNVWEQVYAAEHPEHPVLEGLNELNVLTLGEDEMESLAKDVLGYGVPALLAKVIETMPDQVAAVMNVVVEMQKLQNSYSNYAYDYSTTEEAPAETVGQ